MAACENAQLPRLRSHFRDHFVRCLTLLRDCAHDDAGIIEEPVCPAEFEKSIGKDQHQGEHLDFPERAAVGHRDGQVTGDLNDAFRCIQQRKAAADCQ
ncbi:hypothetical protein Q669_21205 [Labrenzia sp. C1B10]|nr:hypothetical protein Q669_21205 [Labrenzia sp. C1B10]ERS01517.1 hypothetical protein Q675_05320 [Labrenzia sp. C1B70]